MVLEFNNSWNNFVSRNNNQDMTFIGIVSFPNEQYSSMSTDTFFPISEMKKIIHIYFLRTYSSPDFPKNQVIKPPNLPSLI